MSGTLQIAVVGVGGQGVVSLARLLGRAAVQAGLEARVGQIHGLSQRGGSVEATVVLGPGNTAYVSPGQAEVVVALEPLEAARALPKISGTASVLVNRTPIVPTNVTLDRVGYPDLGSLVSQIEDVAREVHLIEGTKLARQAGSGRLLNVVMVGVVAGLDLLPVPPGALAATAEQFHGSPHTVARRKAFSLGEELGRELAASRLLTGRAAIGEPGRDHPAAPQR